MNTSDPTSRITDEMRTLAASERRLQTAIRDAIADGASPRDIEQAMRRAAAGRPDFTEPVEDRIAQLPGRAAA
jgi:hypothetical protein